ncbi:hypothetical protein K9M74_01335 [Candidatus Woesearchaeota archaeon]|nr:hypothetical protein [Candidatus Woesearchaeota archaeon]
MKKGIRSDQNNRKVLTSKKLYDTVATELPTGRILELSKSYVTLQVFSDKGFIKTKTDYKCPYCNNKEITEEHTKTQEQEEKIIIDVFCKQCKQLLISETLTKNEL